VRGAVECRAWRLLLPPAPAPGLGLSNVAPPPLPSCSCSRVRVVVLQRAFTSKTSFNFNLQRPTFSPRGSGRFRLRLVAVSLLSPFIVQYSCCAADF
jgi:hypothetical protein